MEPSGLAQRLSSSCQAFLPVDRWRLWGCVCRLSPGMVLEVELWVCPIPGEGGSEEEWMAYGLWDRQDRFEALSLPVTSKLLNLLKAHLSYL